MNWFSGLEGVCRLDVPLAEHTWYGLGGPARWFFTPHTEDELGAVLQRCAQHAIPWRVLGRGANVLVRDQGFPGAVIKLAWDLTDLNDPQAVRAAAGTDFTSLVKATVERGYGGLEHLAGIPGSVGGIIRMNAGGKYGYVAQYVRAVQLMTPEAQVLTRRPEELGLGYRSSQLNGAVVIAATFRLEPGDREAIRARFQEIWREKHAAQPSVSAKSAGCIFKNPPGHAAGKLIDEAGLKGHRCGGAEISTKHANFIVAYPGATAQDVLNLIEVAKERVLRSAGVELELEVEIW